MIITIASLALACTFLTLSWDEDNIWKTVACALVLVVSVSAIRIDSWVDGHEDGVCDVYDAMQDAGKVRPGHRPLEFCDD